MAQESITKNWGNGNDMLQYWDPQNHKTKSKKSKKKPHKRAVSYYKKWMLSAAFQKFDPTRELLDNGTDKCTVNHFHVGLFFMDEQWVFFLPQTLHGIGEKYLHMLFTMHGLSCKFKSPAKRMSILLDHLQSDHGWTDEDLKLVKSNLPKSMKEAPSKPKLPSAHFNALHEVIFI